MVGQRPQAVRGDEDGTALPSLELRPLFGEIFLPSLGCFPHQGPQEKRFLTAKLVNHGSAASEPRETLHHPVDVAGPFAAIEDQHAVVIAVWPQPGPWGVFSS